MMLDHLGQGSAARAITTAVGHVLAEGGARTPDVGGTASTKQAGAAITDAL